MLYGNAFANNTFESKVRPILALTTTTADSGDDTVGER